MGSNGIYGDFSGDLVWDSMGFILWCHRLHGWKIPGH